MDGNLNKLNMYLDDNKEPCTQCNVNTEHCIKCGTCQECNPPVKCDVCGNNKCVGCTTCDYCYQDWEDEYYNTFSPEED